MKPDTHPRELQQGNQTMVPVMDKPSTHWLVLSPVLATLGLLTHHASANPGFAVSAESTNNSSGSFNDRFEQFNPAYQFGVDTFGGYTKALVRSRANATATAQFGVLGVSNQVSVGPGFEAGSMARSTVKAGWIDTITINAPGLTGQSGTYNASVHVHMAYAYNGAEATNSNVFGVTVGTNIGGAYEFGEAGYGFLGMDAPVLADGRSFNETLNFSIPFTYGTPFNVAVTMLSGMTLNSSPFNDPYSISHNASNTVSWGGTTSVLDASNNPLAAGAFTVTSASGTNYRNAIGGPVTPTPRLLNVVIQPPAAGQSPRFSGGVAGGPPMGAARLQSSLDLGNEDAWSDIATQPLDAEGAATFTNIPDTRPQALGAKACFFRVIAEPTN